MRLFFTLSTHIGVLYSASLYIGKFYDSHYLKEFAIFPSDSACYPHIYFSPITTYSSFAYYNEIMRNIYPLNRQMAQ